MKKDVSSTSLWPINKNYMLHRWIRTYTTAVPNTGPKNLGEDILKDMVAKYCWVLFSELLVATEEKRKTVAINHLSVCPIPCREEI